MAIGDVYRLSIVGTAIDQTIVNTLHFRQTGAIPGGIPSPERIIFQFSGGGPPTPLTTYLNCLPALYSIRELNVINYTNPFDNISTQVTGVGGRGSGEICPPQCTSLLSIRTQALGRSYRGRMFIGPVLETDQSNGVMSQALQDRLQLFINQVIASFVPPPFDWVVYSRELNQATSVTRVIIRAFMATQRRRSRYNPG